MASNKRMVEARRQEHVATQAPPPSSHPPPHRGPQEDQIVLHAQVLVEVRDSNWHAQLLSDVRNFQLTRATSN